MPDRAGQPALSIFVVRDRLFLTKPVFRAKIMQKCGMMCLGSFPAENDLKNLHMFAKFELMSWPAQSWQGFFVF
jgi:hypothetical protein